MQEQKSISGMSDAVKRNFTDCGPDQPPTRNLPFNVAVEYLRNGMRITRRGFFGHIFMIKNAQLTYALKDGNVGGIAIDQVVVMCGPDSKYRLIEFGAEDISCNEWELLP